MLQKKIVALGIDGGVMEAGSRAFNTSNGRHGKRMSRQVMMKEECLQKHGKTLSETVRRDCL
eukprot:11688556-Karenia_brevis.AAC.1